MKRTGSFKHHAARTGGVLLISMVCTLAASAELRVAGKASSIAIEAPVAALALRDDSFPPAATLAIRLSAITPLAYAKVALTSDEDGKRMRIGSRRDISLETEAKSGPAELQWVAMRGGGLTTRISVTSPLASALRVGLAIRDLPEGVEMRFIGAGTAQRAVAAFGAAEVTAAARSQGIYWTPLTEGEMQTIEVWVPGGADAARVRISAETASHLDARPSQLFKASTGVGSAQACNLDAACATSSNEALAKAARSVAKMVFTENGVTYLCSGTLVSDGNARSEIPYLYTAAHCLHSQAAAATLNTFWFFESSTCGGSAEVAYKQLSGGATLLYSNPTSDAALLRLSERAPPGAWFSGWEASPLAAGTALVGIHHPKGDVKKISLGQSLAATTNAVGGTYLTAAWIVGSTEGGSSGSGIFTLSGGEYVLRGGLRGGSASCQSTGAMNDPSNRDYYSRLDQEAATMRTWLDAAAAPFEDFTGMWSDPAEPGWGLSIIQGASNRVFGALFAYDAEGKPTWLVMPEGAWRTTSVYEATAYRTTGTAIYHPYDASRSSLNPVGSARIEFGRDGQATLSLTLEGRTTVKPIRRLVS